MWQNCWAHRAGPPTFKARLRSRMCVDVPQGRDLNIARITRTWGMVRVPKVGVVRFRWTMDLPVGKHADAANRITGARLAREANGWHVVLRVLTQVKEPVPHTGPGWVSTGVWPNRWPCPMTPSANTGRGCLRVSRSVCAGWSARPHANGATAKRVR